MRFDLDEIKPVTQFNDDIKMQLNLSSVTFQFVIFVFGGSFDHKT